MTIAHCPKCRERVSLPLGASRQARVRCPLCSEEYLLDDAFQDLPPLLVVVHDPEARTSEMLDEGPGLAPSFTNLKYGGAPPAAVDETVSELSLEPGTPVAAPAFNFEPGSAVAVSRGSSTASRPRTRRKQGGAFRMIVQTVGGGVMGLIIAQLILWWMPGNWAKENRDPFGLANKIAAYVPAIVPVMLRDGSATAHGEPPATPPAIDSSRPDTAAGGADQVGVNASPDLEAKIPDFKFNADQTTGNEKAPADQKKKRNAKKEVVTTPEEFPLPGLNEPAPTGTFLGGSGKGADRVVPPDITLEPINPATKADDDKTEKVPPPTKAPDVSTDVTDDNAMKENATKDQSAKDQATSETVSQKPIASDITSRLQDVATAKQAWDTADKDASNQTKFELITDLFVKLAQLGETAARIGPAKVGNAELVAPVHEKLMELVVQPDTLAPLSKLAVRRLQDDLDKGGLIVGVVLSHQLRGKIYETQVRLAAKPDQVVTLVSPVDLAGQLAAHTNVLVLGRWISKPAVNLAGYEGDADAVLLHGVHVGVPTASPPPN